MALITWSDSLSVRVPALDAQHQRLIAMINELHAAMTQGKGRDRLQPLLASLLQYTLTHFRDEERHLQQIKFPDFVVHKAEHEKLTRRVQEMSDKLAAQQISLTVDLMNFLRDWLTNHIQRMDQKYAPKAVASTT